MQTPPQRANHHPLSVGPAVKGDGDAIRPPDSAPAHASQLHGHAIRRRLELAQPPQQGVSGLATVLLHRLSPGAEATLGQEPEEILDVFLHQARKRATALVITGFPEGPKVTSARLPSSCVQARVVSRSPFSTKPEKRTDP